jgi:pimeloyl-ACP methyl ester carboxylesterase
VIACAATASVAPFEADGLDWGAGMAVENLEEARLALEGEAALVPYLERMAATFRDLPPDRLASGLGDLISAVDAETLGGAFGVHAKAMLEESVSTGLSGWADDDAALFGRWGFELSGIRVAVSVWHGGQDQAVPFAHGQWLAERIPGATPHLFPEEGHLSLIVAAFPQVLDELLRNG